MIDYSTFQLNSPKQWRKLVVNAREMMDMQCINGVILLNDYLCDLLGEYEAVKACTVLSDCCSQDELARQVSIMFRLQSLPLQFKLSDCKYKREHFELVFSTDLNRIRKQDEAPRAGADSSL